MGLSEQLITTENKRGSCFIREKKLKGAPCPLPCSTTNHLSNGKPWLHWIPLISIFHLHQHRATWAALTCLKTSVRNWSRRTASKKSSWIQLIQYDPIFDICLIIDIDQLDHIWISNIGDIQYSIYWSLIQWIPASVISVMQFRNSHRAIMGHWHVHINAPPCTICTQNEKMHPYVT